MFAEVLDLRSENFCFFTPLAGLALLSEKTIKTNKRTSGKTVFIGENVRVLQYC